jgi:hypothetical protein
MDTIKKAKFLKNRIIAAGDGCAELQTDYLIEVLDAYITAVDNIKYLKTQITCCSGSCKFTPNQTEDSSKE